MPNNTQAMTMYPQDIPKPNHQLNSIRASFTMDYDFNVVFSEHCFSVSNAQLAELLSLKINGRCSILVYVDSGLAEAQPTLVDSINSYCEHYSQSILALSSPTVVLGGESCKTVEHVQSVYSHMLRNKLDRHCMVVAIGGGAFLDMIGFAAATFHRGIPLIRMPSTVLAQNDAGIGVKNGFNAHGLKNLIGSFTPPFAVLNDTALLDSLEKRDRIAGHAEAVKVAAIRDIDFFTWLEKNASALFNLEREATQYAIKRCAELHLNQITQAGDPFESGNARPLDYGHWSAHKLEALSHYDLRHGEAVAIGMALDALYALEIELLSENDAQRLLSVLRNLGFTLWHPALDLEIHQKPTVLLGIEEFRQHLGGELCVTLLQNLGTGVEVNDIDEQSMIRALHALKTAAL